MPHIQPLQVINPVCTNDIVRARELCENHVCTDDIVSARELCENHVRTDDIVRARELWENHVCTNHLPFHLYKQRLVPR